jgi:O-acetylserine/cysteine efflux transporter
MKPVHALLALLIALIWGFNFVVIKVGLHGLPPILFTALRFTCAAFPAVLFIKRPHVPWRFLAGYAMFPFALQFTLLFWGINIGFPPGLASLVVQLQVFFTILFSVILFRERPGKMQLLGVAIGFCSMALVAAHLEASSGLRGFLMVLLGAIAWGIGNILMKRMGEVEPVALVVWSSLLSVPPLFLASALIEGPAAMSAAIQHVGWTSVGAILFQAYPSTIIGFGIWAALMQRYPTATIVPFALLVPIAALISASLVLGEPMQAWKIVAAALVLGGVGLSQTGGRKRTSPARAHSAST